MAAVSQPGSRAGLITVLVIFVVLFFVSATFWIVNMNDAKAKEVKLAELQKTYDNVISRTELSTEKEAISVLRQPPNSNRSFYDISRSQRDDLLKLVTGQANGTVPAAIKKAEDAVADINKQLQPANVSVPGSSLLDATKKLAEAVLSQHNQVDAIAAQLAAKNEELKQKDLVRNQETGEHLKSVEAAKAEAGGAVKDSETYRQTKDTQIATLEKSLQDTIEKDRKAAEELTVSLTTKTQELEKLQKELKKAIDKLAGHRPRDVAEAAVRRPAGRIIQVSRGNVVYIDLGQGQQISSGMTFELYDRAEGVPATNLTDSDDQLPVGKGSLEVVRVGQGSSECRVIRLSHGMQPLEGDVIANLIYDPNVKRAFKVFGDFDLDQNGVATSAETDIVKRLVVQWGGKLTEKVNIDTDYVVLGKEPVLPSYTKEQIQDNPLLKFELDKATAAQKAYDEVKVAALELHIPVLNQNRFLYMIGYFDQAKK